MLENIRKGINKFWYGDEKGKVKITQKDIKKNAAKIQRRMEKIQAERDKIADKMEEIDISDDEGREAYRKLNEELKLRNEAYSALQKEEQEEYNTIKKMKDSKFLIAPKDAIMISGLFILGTLAIALERENPKAIKIVSFITKLFPMHM